MNYKSVGIIDVKSIITPSITDTFQRHLIYARELRKLDDRYQLRIISNTMECYQAESDSFKFLALGNRRRNILAFFAKTLKEIKKDPPALLIAGDPWVSFLFAYLISLNVSPHIPIQVQLHADISDPSWFKHSMRNRFKRFICKFFLRAADEIRFVSSIQKQLVQNDLNIHDKRWFLAAVPLNISDPTYFREGRKDRNSIGFIGRVDSDRGLDILLKVLKELNNCPNPPSLIIVGDGNKRKDLIQKIETYAPKIKVNFLGFLPGAEMENAWMKIDVLLSTAPSESYGRTIREALVHGIPVIALRSNGVTKLSESIKSPFLQIFDTESIAELIPIFYAAKNALITREISETLISESRENRRKIVLSWAAWLND
jgi:glycosyltransferase involved in cell wall biosynthesis